MTRRFRVFIAAVAPLAVLLVGIFKESISGLQKYFHGCRFHAITGYWCPGCGNTRCVTELLHGHLLNALHYNITIPFLLLLLILLYAENISVICGRELRLLPRSGFVWGGVITAFIIYYILRNFIPAIAPL